MDLAKGNDAMGLQYKPDWEGTKERFCAWWEHEYFGRCALAVSAPLDHPPDRPALPEPTTLHEKWYDLDAISARNDYNMSRTFYGGESIPLWSPGYPGFASLSTIHGCRIELDLRTGWHHPVLTDPDRLDVSDVKLDRSNPGYIYAMEVLQRAAQEAPGKSIPSIGAFGGCGDTLANLRGAEQLLFDCVERPDAVQKADMALMDMWCDFFDRCREPIREASDGGTACWFGVWSPGRHYCAHNDFSYNISPAMFRDIFLPVIERQTLFLDHTVYHVDGIEAFAHVDALCELPRLQAVQILPGAGKPSALHNMDVLKKVQAAGKGLQIYLAPEEVRPALEQLSARGLLITTGCETEAQARQLLKDAERWSVDRG